MFDTFAMINLVEVCDWESQLAKIQTILEIWIHVQQHWLYLEPIFTTEDIVMQMPTEGTLFKVRINQIGSTNRAAQGPGFILFISILHLYLYIYSPF